LAATIYYVSPSGSDSNAGTESAPWRTVQKAIDSLAPGDTALIRGGSYGSADCVGSADSGSASGGYVTLKAYPGENPVLSAAADGVLYINCDYLRVEGLKIAGPGAVGGTLVYGVEPSHHVELIGNEITGSVCQGTYLDEGTHHYSIVRNRIHDNGTSACDRQAHGIYLEGNDHLVASNVIYNHPEGFGVQIYDKGLRSLVTGNTITHSGHGGIVCGGSGGVSCTIVNNIVAYNGTYGIDRDASAPSSCSIHHNLAFANGTNYDPTFNCLSANLTGNPLFVSDAARDYHLLSGSPAIDTGDSSLAWSPDFDGAARPQGAGPDIGAFERPSTTSAPVNTSLSAISGTPEDGRTLTASTGTWTNSPTSYAYQWRRCDGAGASCASIAGPIGQSYVLVSADVGSTIRVVVTASNSAGSASATSAQTAAVAAVPPANTVRPALSGNAIDGRTLTTTTGTWSGTTPIAYSYQWRRCDSAGANCVDIAEAAGQSYTLTSADVGSKVYAGVTATNVAGSAWMRTYLSALVAAAAPANSTRPALSGTAIDGQTLTTTTGTWSGTTPIAYSYQWRRCDTSGNDCSTIAGASGQSYILTAADVGFKVYALVTATNAAGSASMRSYLSATVLAAAPVNAVRPALSGTARAGQTLTTTTGTWSGTALITYAFGWRRCDTSGNNCSTIAAASGQSYTLTAAEVGFKVYALVTASNAAGSASMRSYLSATVAP